MPRDADNPGKDGHGFCMVAAVTQTGLPLGARLMRIQDDEATAARSILEDEWRRIVAPYLCGDKVRIMAGDGAYSGPDMRSAVHRAGFVPNTHTVSHANRERSLNNAEGRRAARLAIRGCKDWHLNGLHEIFCACGKGKTYRRVGKKKSGEAVARLEGSCPNCGSVSLTAGQWRLFETNKAVAKALPSEKHKIDWRIGNPLTFDDPVSKREAGLDTARRGVPRKFGHPFRAAPREGLVPRPPPGRARLHAGLLRSPQHRQTPAATRRPWSAWRSLDGCQRPTAATRPSCVEQLAGTLNLTSKKRPADIRWALSAR